MKPLVQFKMGSQVFFNEYKCFSPNDYDELCIMDSFIEGNNSFRCKIEGKDVFFYRNLDKQGFIKDCLNSNLPMKAGKFLVPEFAKYLGLTIEDLKILKPVIANIDDKHEYEKVIYDSYIENNDFYLTEEQRLSAYTLYIKWRSANENN